MRKTTLKHPIKVCAVEVELDDAGLTLEQPTINGQGKDTVFLNQAQVKALIRFLTPKPREPKARAPIRKGSRVKLNTRNPLNQALPMGFDTEDVYVVEGKDGKYVKVNGEWWYAERFVKV